jgi:hypothetical protein
VTDQSGSLLEADDGDKVSSWTGVKYTRIVRAVLIGRDSATTVMLTALETRNDQRGFQKQVRISNKTGGNGGKVWRKMVAAAQALDATQVPPPALAEKSS